MRMEICIRESLKIIERMGLERFCMRGWKESGWRMEK